MAAKAVSWCGPDALVLAHRAFLALPAAAEFWFAACERVVQSPHRIGRRARGQAVAPSAVFERRLVERPMG